MATTTKWISKQQNPLVVSGIATIDAGETATLPIPCGGRAVVRLGFPTMVGTTATFTVQAYPPADPAAPTLAPPFRPLYKNDGATQVSITVTDNSMVEVPQLSGCYAFTIISGSAETMGAAIEVQMVGSEPSPFDDSAGGAIPPGDFAAPALTLGTSNVAGSSGKVLATDATILTFDGTTPAAEAFGAAGTVGVATTATRRDHVHPMPAFATPAIALGTAAAAGAATTPIRSDATIVAFDATVPPAETNPATAAAGAATVAARRDHLHAVATPATPTTAAFGDAPTSGAGTGFATDTHKHGMPVVTFS